MISVGTGGAHLMRRCTGRRATLTPSGASTAFPLPKPGDGAAPKPVTLPAGKLHEALGIREVTYRKGVQTLAIKDQSLV
jgi:hypothetical protein